MKRGSAVSAAQVESATRAVQGELAEAGLWQEGAPVRETEVYWCRFPQPLDADALGFFVEEASWFRGLLGYEMGNIYIPSWVLSHGPWQRRGSLRDILRHEYAHALAWHQPGLISRSREFREVFGGRYEAETERPGGERDYVTAYAEVSPAEDLAETFMVWLRKRRSPDSCSRALRRKFRFVESWVRRLSR